MTDVKSYHDIQVLFLGQKYLARLYGDFLEITDLNQKLTRADITRFRIWPIGNYHVYTSNPAFGHFQIIPHRQVARWLDKFYFARQVLLAFIFIASTALALYVLPTSQWYGAVLFGFGNLLMAWLFLRWLRLPVRKIFSYASALFLPYALATFYVFPFAWVLYVLFFVNLFICLFFVYLPPTSIKPAKFFMAISWVLFSFANYNWMLFTLSTLQARSAQEVNSGSKLQLLKNPDRIKVGSNEWVVPIIYKAKEYATFDRLAKTRSLLHDLSPYRIQHVLKYNQGKHQILISTSKMSVSNTLSLNQVYLKNGSQYLWSLFMAESTRYDMPVKELGLKATLVGYLLFDLSALKNRLLFNVVVPIKEGVYLKGSIVFSFMLNEEESPETNLLAIVDSFKKAIKAKSPANQK